MIYISFKQALRVDKNRLSTQGELENFIKKWKIIQDIFGIAGWLDRLN